MKFVSPERERLSVLLAACGVKNALFHRLLRKKDVLVDGVRADEDRAVPKGAAVEAYCALPLPAVYEDASLMIADKPAGMLSVGSLSAESLLRENGRESIRACHRLDRNTAGLLMFAKSDGAEHAAVAALSDHSVEKVYTAVAVSRTDVGAGRASAYLFKDAEAAKVTVTDRPGKGAKPIETAWRQLRRIDETLVFVEVTIRTGRTHQIRAHLAHLGFPVLGDEKYGNFAANRAYRRFRQCLVASELRCHVLPPPIDAISGRIFRSSYPAWQPPAPQKTEE